MRTKTKVVAAIVAATIAIVLFSAVITLLSHISAWIGESGDTAVMYIVGIFFLLSGLFVLWAWRKNHPRDVSATPTPTTTNRQSAGRIRKWWNEEKDWGIFALVLLVIIGFHYLWHHYWPIAWTIEARKPFFWISQVAILLIVIFFSKENKGSRELPMIAKIAIGMFALINAIDYLEVHNLLGRMQKMSNDGGRSSIPTVPLPPPSLEGEKLVREAFSFLPPDQIEEMVAICRRESGCNQYETDGVTPLRGRINPNDFGRMQDNKDWWEKELRMYGTEEMKSWDMKTSEGNLKIAVYLRKKYHTAPWNPSRKALFAKSENLVVAPEDDWSKPFPLNGRRFRTDGGDGAVLVKIDERPPIMDGPSAIFGRGKSLRVKSVTGEKVIMAVTFY